jgi:uracil-DNA glycosylase family 4
MAEDESNNSEDDRTRKLRSLSVLHAKIDTCLRCAETIPGVEKLVGTKRGEPGRIFIVGEGPGRKEKEKGVAFAGGSGTRLNKWLVECGANPTDPRAGIYLTSVTKCIAPEKLALCEMVRKCRPFLIKQLQVLRPSLVITLGKPAYESLALSDLPYNRSLCRAQASTELLLLSELDFDYTLLPWPHPSGLNRWFNTPQNGDRLRASFSIVRRVLQGSS